MKRIIGILCVILVFASCFTCAIASTFDLSLLTDEGLQELLVVVENEIKQRESESLVVEIEVNKTKIPLNAVYNTALDILLQTDDNIEKAIEMLGDPFYVSSDMTIVCRYSWSNISITTRNDIIVSFAIIDIKGEWITTHGIGCKSLLPDELISAAHIFTSASTISYSFYYLSDYTQVDNYKDSDYSVLYNLRDGEVRSIEVSQTQN